MFGRKKREETLPNGLQVPETATVEVSAAPPVEPTALAPVGPIPPAQPNAPTDRRADLKAALREVMQAAAAAQGAMASIAPMAGAVHPTEDPLDQLKKLADLHQSGALTDAEFEQVKKKLLGEL